MRHNTILSTLLLLSSRALAQIPDDFTSGFDPSDIELVVSYNDNEISDGETLSPSDTSTIPDFALGDSSSINKNTRYTILLIDPDSPSQDDTVSPQVLHYLGTDFFVSDKTNLATSSEPTVPYSGADLATGTGEHRFIFLLYVQPSEGFVVQGIPSADQMGSFDVQSWREANGLDAAVAGVHFIATPSGADAAEEGVSESSTAAEYTGGNGAAAATTSCTQSAIQELPVETSTGEYVYEPEPTSEPAMVHTTAEAVAEPTATESAAATHTVTVGGPDLLTYQPPHVIANPGDEIVFDFLSRNHTLTQSTLAEPCSFLAGGVDSGYKPNPDNISGQQLFTFTVPDSKPQWFYCAQGRHCQMGMVFAVNPGDKMEEFVSRATAGAASSTASVISPTVTSEPPMVYTTSEPPMVHTTSEPAVVDTTSAAVSEPITTAAPPESQEPAATSVASATQTVTVGGPNLLTFQPSSVNANPGDVIVFDFLSRNHTLTQSTLANPCSFLQGGVDSGYKPNPDNISGQQLFTYTVPDAQPKWFYCAQGSHCQSGMVFAVNPGDEMEEFVSRATSGSATSSAVGSVPTGLTGNVTTNGTTPVVFPGAAGRVTVGGWGVAALVGVVGLALGL